MMITLFIFKMVRFSKKDTMKMDMRNLFTMTKMEMKFRNVSLMGKGLLKETKSYTIRMDQNNHNCLMKKGSYKELRLIISETGKHNWKLYIKIISKMESLNIINKMVRSSMSVNF
jgi:hypothetical protein